MKMNTVIIIIMSQRGELRNRGAKTRLRTPGDDMRPRYPTPGRLLQPLPLSSPVFS